MKTSVRLALGFLFAAAATGCWRQPVVPSLIQDQVVFENRAIDSGYPGTRELMNAPSTDPALGEHSSGNLTRP
jgi:hypothetical protein